MDTLFVEDVGFTKVLDIPITLHKEIPDDRIQVLPHYRKICIMDTEDTRDIDTPSILHSETVPMTVYIEKEVMYVLQTAYCIVCQQVHDAQSVDDPFLEEIQNNMSNWRHLMVIIRLVRHGMKYTMSYYIVNRVINNVLQKNREHGRDQLRMLLWRGVYDQVQEGIIGALHEITSESSGSTGGSVIMDTSLLRDHITLMEYQKADVRWMQQIEEDIRNGTNVIRHDYMMVQRVMGTMQGDFYMTYKNTLEPHNVIDVYTARNGLKYVGGSLISDIGLGKTLVMLYHILSSNTEGARYNKFVEVGKGCSYTLKRGTNRGRICGRVVNELGYYCKKHAGIPVEKRVLEYKNVEDIYVPDFIIDIERIDGSTSRVEKRFIANGSIVICPNHICEQWVREYYDKFSGKHRIVMIATKDQYMNVELGDLLFADIVIVTYQFLASEFYTKKSKARVHVGDIRELYHTVEDMLHSKAHTIFKAFWWRQVVFDEAHEIRSRYDSGRLERCLHEISGRSKWNLTGTPFATGVSGFLSLLGYTSNYYKDWEWGPSMIRNASNMLRTGCDTLFVNKCAKLFRKNSKESVRGEYTSTKVTTETRKLEFTEEERSIYNSYIRGMTKKNMRLLVQLCCHCELHDDFRLHIENCKTFEEIQIQLIQLQDEQVAKYKQEMDIVEEALDKAKQNKESGGIIGGIKREHARVMKKYNDARRTCEFLKESVATLNAPKEGETCPICLESYKDIRERGVAITTCGHKFCWGCIQELNTIQSAGSTKGIQKCPFCNTKITMEDVYRITDRQQSAESDVDKLVRSVRSTKIGNIIHFINTTLTADDKVILFSQWDDLLHRVGGKLEQNDIKIVYCSGTIYQKRAAIDKFMKDGDVQVIMLSSQNAASGINLTAANKVILLEPVYGSEDYRKDIESQAIGRADRIGQKREVAVFRFIIKDTVEEDIVENRVADGVLRNLRVH